jgi:hypothetical protein
MEAPFIQPQAKQKAPQALSTKTEAAELKSFATNNLLQWGNP